MKIAHRTRAHIDLTFIEGAQKLGKYHQEPYGIANNLKS